MKLRPMYAIGLLIGAMLLTSALAMGRLQSARGTQATAMSRLHAAQADAQELLSLQSQDELIGSSRRAPEDVTGRLRDAMLASGLTSDRLTNYAEKGDTELRGGAIGASGPQYRRQTIAFTVTPIELQELGTFLDRWRQTEPLWVPVSLELTRVNTNQRARNAPSGYRASISIAATYVDTTATRNTP